MRKLIAIFALSMLTASAAFAADPNNARGFEAGKMYDFLGLDTVSVFNGNLMVGIPIGQKYMIRPGFEYQIVLSYNSKVWDYTSLGSVRTAFPELNSNAGLGWTLSLGRIIDRGVPDPVLYVSPDGAEHSLEVRPNDPNHIGHTFDESYLRITRSTDKDVMESSDGLKYEFDVNGRLKQITDRFDHWVKVGYDSQGSWTITDGHGIAPAAVTTGRTHYVDFENAPADKYSGGNANFQIRVDKVRLTAFGGAMAVYEFHYDDPQITGTSCGLSEGQPPDLVNIPLLNGVDLPAGAGSFAFEYYLTDAGAPCSPGSLKAMALPTRGSIEWEYGIYQLSHPDCAISSTSGSSLWFDDHAGVVKRTLKDAGDHVLERSTYEPDLRDEPVRQITCDEGGDLISIQGPGPPKVMTNTVTDLTGRRTVHYFSAYGAIRSFYKTPDVELADYGLPLTRTETASNGHFVSTKVFDGNVLLRTNYVQYDYGARNPRLLSSRTVFNSDICRTNPDEECFVQKTNSDFDAVGHYRSQTTTSNLHGLTTTRTSYKNYNPGNTASTLWPTSAPWILNAYTTSTETEDGISRSTDTKFLDNKGVIESVQTGTGADAILNVTCRDARGFVTRERSVFKGGAPRVDCGGSPTALTDGEYELTHTNGFYANGTLLVSRSSRYLGSDFDVADETLDRHTTLPNSTRDPAGLATTYAFDTLGRITTVTLPGGPTTSYVYRAATATLPARVTETASGGSLSMTRHYDYDDVGHLHRELRSMPLGGWALRETTYDNGGRVATSSEWIGVSSPDDTTTHPISSQRTSTTYDVLGRPLMTTRPDGSTTTHAYVSDHTMTRTTAVVTTTGEKDNETIEKYDAMGRIVSVKERAGARTGSDSLGAPSTTTYTYSPTGKLRTVTSGTQSPRTFTYDHRDLLTQESHPEQTVTYGSYDAKGQFRSRDDGRGLLTYVYDEAARLEFVKSGSTEIKKFEFGDSGPKKGKLWRGTRRNDLLKAGTILVTDEYTYSATHGKPTARTTTVTKNGQTVQSFSESIQYDGLLALSEITYPTCTGCVVPSGGIGTVSLEHDQGLLTKLSAGGTTYGTLTYWPNGMVHTVTHGAAGNVVDTYTADGALPRPASIAFGGVVACNAPATPVITTNAAESCASQPGWAEVPAQQGVTFAWTISGGTFVGGNTGTHVNFTAGSSGSATLTVMATNDCATSEASRQLAIGPTASLSRGAAANDMVVTLTGAGPWNVVWQDGFPQNGIAASPAHRFVTQPAVYSVASVSDSVCGGGSTSGQVTFVIPPSFVSATTQANGSVLVGWSSVLNATSYEIERGTKVTDETTFAIIGTTTGLSLVDGGVAGPNATAYVYRLRALLGAERSAPSVSDYATTAATLFTDDPLTIGVTVVKAAHLNQLRAAVDALRFAAGLTPAFAGVPGASAMIQAIDVTGLIGPLNAARAPWGYLPFGYSPGIPYPAAGVAIRAAHLQQLREALK